MLTDQPLWRPSPDGNEEQIVNKLVLGLKTRLIIVGCLAVAVTTSTLAHFALVHSQRQLRANVAAQQFVLVSALAGNLDDRLALAQGELAQIAHGIPSGTLQDPARAQRFLESQSEHRATFDSALLILSRQGELLAETPLVPGHQDLNHAFRDQVRKTMSSAKPIISSPFFSSEVSRLPVVALTVPIVNARGEAQGVLAGTIDLLSVFLTATIVLSLGGLYSPSSARCAIKARKGRLNWNAPRRRRRSGKM
jgi:hypothetical protein